MKLNNKLGERKIVVTMPSGDSTRVTLPEGEFDLPEIYVRAMRELPVGQYYLKKMKPRKPRKKNADNIDSEGSQEPPSTEGS